jgi:hypothetical protein
MNDSHWSESLYLNINDNNLTSGAVLVWWSQAWVARSVENYAG